MRGSIRKRSNGTLSIRYDVIDGNGVRKQVEEAVKGSKKNAESVLRERISAVENGGFVSKSAETVTQFIERWLRDYASVNVAPSTMRGYQSKINCYIVPYLGTVKLQALTARHVQAMYSKMLDAGLSASTCLHAHRVIREALNHGVKWGLIVRNPADGATPPRREVKPLDMWDAATINKFLDVVAGSEFRDLYHLAILTGMRRSEILGLEWANVDIDGGVLRIVRTLQRISGHGIHQGKPKTTAGKRSVALSSDAISLLRRVHTAQLEHRLAVGPAWQSYDLVFTQADGKPLHPDKVSYDFRQRVDSAELPYLTFHGLRHAHATMLLQGGVHPRIVSERLGHASIGITLDVYSHVLPNMQESAAIAIDAALAQA